MSGHTPGPWYLAGKTVYALNVRNFNRFCAQVQDAHTPESELIANAVLMQAAPELLEALEAAIECGMVPNTSAAEGGASRFSRQVVVADMIRAAIARARGQ
jgi:hypothetical protein